MRLTRAGLGHAEVIFRAVYNPLGNRAASIDYAGQLFVWDVASATPLFHQQLPLSAGYGVAYSTDGQELAVSGQDSRLFMVKLHPGAY